MLRNQLQRQFRTNFLLSRNSKLTFSTSSYYLSNNNSPLKVFVDTFRKEWGKSQELKDNIKALQDETGRMAESEAFHKAKEAYDRAQKSRSVASQGLKKTAEVVGDAAVKAWESPVGKATRSTVKITAEVIDKSIDPLRNTAVYKEVSKVIDDGSSSRYGGFLTKEERQRKREELIKSGKRAKIIKSDEDAGTALIATKHKPTGPSWTDKITFLRPNTFLGKLLAELRFRYEETDNRLISTIRTIIEKIGGFFAETENGRVIRAFKDIDPSFNIEDFNTQLRDYIVPEVLDAYVQGDELILKKWFSEAPFNVVQAQQKAMKDQGLFSDGKILDIRGVDIVSAKILPPSNIPVLVIGCRAQEIQLFRDFKTGEIKAGTEENIMLSSYAMVITRIPEDVDNPDTEGWKILEFVRGGSRQFT